MYSGLKKDVLIDRNNLNKPIYKIYNIKDWDSNKSLDISQILKENGTDYSEVEWETFYSEKTGNAQNENISVEVTNSVTSVLNSTTSTLTASQFFTGVAEINDYADVMVSVSTDKKGKLFCEFSPDGVNWDSSLSFTYDPTAINPPQILVKAERYFRARFQNTDTTTQTYLRLHTYFGDFNKLTSSLNSVIPQTFGATVTRPIDFNLMVAKRLYQGHEPTLKDGINLDIDTGTVPEDIWSIGGVYTGFPTNPEVGQVVVAGADTGTVFYSYLASSTDENYTFGSVAVTGAGTYNLGHNVWRCNYMLFVSASGDFNVSLITVRQAVTTTNIFSSIQPGQGQSFCAAYTVPKGHTAYIDRITASIRGANTGASADMFFWWRRNGQSPLLRIPFVVTFGTLYFDDIDYLIEIPELTDIIPRCTNVSASNTIVHVNYRIVKVKN